MADQTEDIADVVPPTTPRRRRILRRILAGLGLAIVAALLLAWFQREEIADDLIQDQLDQLGLEASYEIESIGQRQVLVNVVVGDPAHPDLTIERVETSLVPRWPFPALGRVRVVRPRLYGTYIGGKLSFGALDKLIFEQPAEEPLRLPDLNLLLEDGRALIEGDAGAVGIKVAGAGNLRDGFAGIVAATAPRLAGGGCVADRATLYGKLTIDDERPGFTGPMRLGSLACPDAALAAKNMVLLLESRLDAGLEGIEGEANFTGRQFAWAENRAGAIEAETRFSWRDAALTATYELGLEQVETPQLALSALALEGSARTREGLARVELEAEADGAGLRPGPALDAALASAASSVGNTLAGPMLVQIRQALAREGRGSSLAAHLTLRRSGEETSLVVPEARWQGASGEALLALSRFQLTMGAAGQPRLSGNFATGGPGLPRISGRMESNGGTGAAEYNLRMAEYRVAGASLALPRLVVSQSGGAYRFSGEMLASGPIPGGDVSRLSLPLEGTWSGGNRFALWTRCANIGFDRLAFGNLELARDSLRLCPSGRGPIIGNDGRGFRVAARVPALELTGMQGDSPLALRTGAFALNFPGSSIVRDIELTLGPPGDASRYTLDAITLDTSQGIGGRFTNSDTFLAAVMLDVLDAEGSWRLANGGIRIDGASFRLVDRTAPARFSPLVARDAELLFAGGWIRARAMLREPKSDRVVTTATIAHNIDTSSGQANLAVDGLLFDDRLQPDALSDYALGVVANVHGTVDGTGKITWSPAGIDSSGTFSSKGIDFAAAFGPVEGVSGTITFTDLLNMVTAPQQVITIHSFDPGIAVDEGTLTFELRPNYEMVIHGGAWPFLGGSLILEPTVTSLSSDNARQFTLRLIGIDAAQFVQRMELANIAATGIFDGRVPLVFDEDGGRLVDGYLVSRPPGGNLSYIGALTYEDLNPIANFAFDALRSLDFRKMEIDLNGSLTGEIVTRVSFDEIRQGAGAKTNLITKQIARLPIRFRVNIRAPFYKLMTSIQTMYDPAFIADPREVGLIDQQGRPVDNPQLNRIPAIKPEDLPQDEAPIQTPDSEDEP